MRRWHRRVFLRVSISQLNVTWDIPASSLAGTAGLSDRMRSSKTTDSVIAEKGDVTAALDRATHVVQATYCGPYQGHMPFGPNCAVADVTPAGTTVMCSTQSVYGVTQRPPSAAEGLRGSGSNWCEEL
jgi:hypothetical protein